MTISPEIMDEIVKFLNLTIVGPKFYYINKKTNSGWNNIKPTFKKHVCGFFISFKLRNIIIPIP